MAELEDALVLGTNEEIRGGSSPSIRIWVCSSVVEHRAFNLVAVGSSPITLNRVNHAIFIIKSLKILYEKINFKVIIQGSLNKENSPLKKNGDFYPFSSQESTLRIKSILGPFLGVSEGILK